MKKDKLKGFTLVEIIVVMLILAILASMFIPNMLGYLERSGETEAIMECRSTVIATQTIINQTFAYGSDEFEGVYKGSIYQIKTTSKKSDDPNSVNIRNFNGINDTLNGVICGIAEADGTITNIQINDNLLLKLTYVSENGNTVLYEYDSDTGYSIVEDD